MTEFCLVPQWERLVKLGKSKVQASIPGGSLYEAMSSNSTMRDIRAARGSIAFTSPSIGQQAQVEALPPASNAIEDGDGDAAGGGLGGGAAPDPMPQHQHDHPGCVFNLIL